MIIPDDTSTIEIIDLPLSVCKVADYSGIDVERPFVFTGSTDTAL